MTKNWIFLWLFLAALVCFVGCAAPRPEADPLAGWHLYNRANLDKDIAGDYNNYLQEVLSDGKHHVGPMFVYKDDTGQYAIKVIISEPNENAEWTYALIYDSQGRRVKVIKYGYRRYVS